MIGGVGRMPSSQAAHDGRNSPTVMNSTTLLGTLPSEVGMIIILMIIIFVMIIFIIMFIIILVTFIKVFVMTIMTNISGERVP